MLRSINVIAGVTGLSIILADWLFYGHPIGANLGLFLLYLFVSVLLSRRARTPHRGRLLAGGILGLLVALFAQPGPLVLAMTLAGIIALALQAREGSTNDAIAWLRRFASYLFLASVQWALDLARLARWRRKRHVKPLLPAFKAGLRGWLFPVAGSCLFLGIFTAANPLLSAWADRSWNFLSLAFLSAEIHPARVMLWGATGIFVWALFRVRTGIRPQPDRGLPVARPIPYQIIIVRSLALFNLVFALQSLLDAMYLWGGRALPEGMSYAYYAHRGAYPLVATALLAGAFTLYAFRPSPPTRETVLERRLVYLWLAQNVFLVISSAWRLHLYMEIYSLTRLRIAAAIWMLLVAAGLIWIGARIVSGNSNRWLLTRNAATMIIVLYLCCFVNFNGLIAQFNVTHCREAGGTGYYLDLNYLQSLGPEALPALALLEKHSTISQWRIDLMRRSLQHDLDQDLLNWRGWSYRRMELATQARMDAP